MTTINRQPRMRRHPPPDPGGIIHIATSTSPRPAGAFAFLELNPMGKSKPSPHAVPGDDSKVAGAAASNVTPIKGRTRHQATDEALEAEGATSPVAADGASTAEPAIILFGRDESGKPHASWFAAADAAVAERAAGLMGYQVLRVLTPDIAAEASKLAAGRIFAASGRGFVPFCKMAAYEALNAFPGVFAPPPPPEPQPEPPLAVSGTPQRWEDLQVGSLVLASTGPDEGWFEAIVAEARGDALYVLRWQGWPDHDPFVRRADGLALLPVPQAAVATDQAAPAEPAA